MHFPLVICWQYVSPTLARSDAWWWQHCLSCAGRAGTLLLFVFSLPRVLWVLSSQQNEVAMLCTSAVKQDSFYLTGVRDNTYLAIRVFGCGLNSCARILGKSSPLLVSGSYFYQNGWCWERPNR